MTKHLFHSINLSKRIISFIANSNDPILAVAEGYLLDAPVVAVPNGADEAASDQVKAHDAIKSLIRHIQGVFMYSDASWMGHA